MPVPFSRTVRVAKASSQCPSNCRIPLVMPRATGAKETVRSKGRRPSAGSTNWLVGLTWDLTLKFFGLFERILVMVKSALPMFKSSICWVLISPTTTRSKSRVVGLKARNLPTPSS